MYTDKNDIEENEDLLLKAASTAPNSRRRHVLFAVIATVISCFISFWVVVDVLTSRTCSSTNERHPFLAGVDHDLYPASLNPFQWNGNKYTQPVSVAGDSVETEWIELGAFYKPVLIPSVYSSGFSLDPSRHYHISHADGTEGYPADVLAIHYLHCINLLPQSLFYNYYYYRSINSTSLRPDQDDYIIAHTGHCIDSLRQLIMCESYDSFLPYLKPEGDEGPHGDFAFAGERKCRNFESLRRWAEEHQWHGANDFQVDDHHHGNRAPVD